MPADRKACSSPHAVTTNVFFTSRNMSCQISTSFQSLGLTAYTQLCYLHFIKRRVSMIQIQFQQFYLCKITWGNIISSVYPSSPFLVSVKKKKKKKEKKSLQAMNSLQMIAQFMGQLLLIGFPQQVHNLWCRDVSFPLAASVRVGTKRTLKYKCDEM